jgi:hypothetical protein
VLCAGFTLLLGEDTPTSSLSGALVRSVTKLASITFLILVLSPTGLIYLGFITEGRLAAVLITPSLGSQLVGHLHQHRIINKFSGAVVGEEEDFCKESLARTIFYFVFSFALLYFCLHLFIKNAKK